MTRQLVGVLAVWTALACMHAAGADAWARGRRAVTVAEQVERLARDASELVRAGEFRRGIARYEEAYRVEPAAALLYNIAFIYDRKLDDPRSAREYYERYLVATDAEPDASARARDRLTDLNARIAEEARELEMAPLNPETSASSSDLRYAVMDPPQADSWAWGFLGTGAVGIAIGTAFHHMAGESADLANNSQGSDRTILAARVKDQELIGWSALGLGAASALTGALLLMVGDDPGDQAGMQLRPVVEPGLTGLTLGSRW